MQRSSKLIPALADPPPTLWFMQHPLHFFPSPSTSPRGKPPRNDNGLPRRIRYGHQRHFQSFPSRKSVLRNSIQSKFESNSVIWNWLFKSYHSVLILAYLFDTIKRTTVTTMMNRLSLTPLCVKTMTMKRVTILKGRKSFAMMILQPRMSRYHLRKTRPKASLWSRPRWSISARSATTSPIRNKLMTGTRGLILARNPSLAPSLYAARASAWRETLPGLVTNSTQLW